LEVQANQIAHRKLAVPGCIDHILEAGRFNEQVFAIGEHLVVHQRMLGPKVLAQVVDGAPNLRQLDLILSPQGVENMRFGEVVERQPGILGISEFDDRLGAPAPA
jgi:hypothetical protein